MGCQVTKLTWFYLSIRLTVAVIAMKCYIDIHGPQMNKSTDSVGLPTFPLAPPVGWTLMFYSDASPQLPDGSMRFMSPSG